MKKKITLVLIVCMVLSLCGCDMLPFWQAEPAETQEAAPTQAAVSQTPGTVEGPGFDSPEAAIMAYAQALQKGDVAQILASFAVETYVDNYDLAAHLEVSTTYTVANQQPIPSSDSYTRELNLVARQYYITRNLTYMYLTLGKVENFLSPITFSGNPYEKPSQLVDDMVICNWMGMLSEMEIGQVLTCEDLGLPSEQITRDMNNQKSYLGCEELIPLAVELTLDGESYYLCVDVACYNGKWYNCSCFGTIGAYLGAYATSGCLYPLED